jgi:hypothetical protein
MKSPTLALLVILFAGVIPSGAEGSILGFYGKAVKRTDSPATAYGHGGYRE